MNLKNMLCTVSLAHESFSKEDTVSLFLVFYQLLKAILCP